MPTKHHILLLGGTGLCGQLFTRAALTEGHQLTLYARTPSKLSPDLASHANLEIIEGTYEDLDGLSRAASCGADVFVSMAGPTLGRREGIPVTNALHHLYPLLLAANPQMRILVLSTPSYSAPQDQRSIKWFLAINGFIRVIGGDSYREIRGIAEATVGLGDKVDWTVFRVPLLSGQALPTSGSLGEENTETPEESTGSQPGRNSRILDGGDASKPLPASTIPDTSESKNELHSKVHAVFVGNKAGYDGLFLDRGRLVQWVLGEIEDRKWIRLSPALANAS